MWDVWDVGCSGCSGCSGCGMFGMWDGRGVGYSGCGMFGMWDVRDVGCGMFAGMWDVDLQNAPPEGSFQLFFVDSQSMYTNKDELLHTNMHLSSLQQNVKTHKRATKTVSKNKLELIF